MPTKNRGQDEQRGNIERQIEFILEHQAKFSEDLELLKEVQVSRQNALNELVRVTASLSDTVASTQVQLDSVSSVMRDGFNKLTLSLMRSRAILPTRLPALKFSRARQLEQRVSDSESRE